MIQQVIAWRSKIRLNCTCDKCLSFVLKCRSLIACVKTTQRIAKRKCYCEENVDFLGRHFLVKCSRFIPASARAW